MNSCLRPDEDETTPHEDDSNTVDVPEEESTASEESNADDMTLSMDNGALTHVLDRGGSAASGDPTLDQWEEDEDMDDVVLDGGYENPTNIFKFGLLQCCDLFPPED